MSTARAVSKSSATHSPYQRLFSLRVGQTLREQFQADLAIEYEVVERLRPGIVMCREKQDSTSANILEEIMKDEESHIDYLETQLALLGKIGEAAYMQLNAVAAGGE